MAILSLQNFETMKQNFASTVQGACKYLVDFSPGSILLSVAEASGSVGLWMQYLILQVLATTRLSTSNGTDADTWVSDFNLSRQAGSYATGTVTFSRLSTGQQALIQPGAQVKTADASQTFTVIADTTKGGWYSLFGGYIINAGQFTVDATVRANNIGVQGNVQAAAISLLASAIPYVDAATNAAAFTTGVDAATDAALRASFSNYIQTRSLATVNAIAYAISTVQQNLTWTIQENTNAIGAYTPGNFLVTVDDGTGTPPGTLIASVLAAVNLVRPIGSTFTVQAPAVTTATISFSFTTTPTANKTATLISAVQAAIVAYVNAVPDGSPLVYTRLSGVAYSVDPSITAVESVVLNGAAVDLTPPLAGAIKTDLAHVAVT